MDDENERDKCRKSRLELKGLQLDVATKAMTSLAWACGLFAIFTAAIVFFVSAFVTRGIVFEPLRTPSEGANSQIDGRSIASRLRDRLGSEIDEADRYSMRSQASIDSDWTDDIQIQIPDTNIGVQNLWHMLRHWIGNEIEVTGEVIRTSNGQTEIRLRAIEAFHETTKLGCDLDCILDDAASQILLQMQPYRYAALQYNQQHYEAAISVLRPIAEDGSDVDRAWADSMLGASLSTRGQNSEALKWLDDGIEIAKSNSKSAEAVLYYVRSGPWLCLGNRERVVGDLEQFLAMAKGRIAREIPQTALDAMLPNARAIVAHYKGAFGDAAKYDLAQQQYEWFGFNEVGPLMTASDSALDHDVGAAEAILSHHPEWNDKKAVEETFKLGPSLPFFFTYIARENWTDAVRELDATDRSFGATSPYDDIRRSFVRPWLAYALARAGRKNEADELIAKTPVANCNLCLEMRARIAELDGRRDAADAWYARAEKDGPSIPFADAAWGADLMKRGSHWYGLAIEKLSEAHLKGPQYAEPLETLGEILIEEGKTDLARARLEEALRYAPNWGHLHVELARAYESTSRQLAESQYSEAKSEWLSSADLRTVNSRVVTNRPSMVQ